MKELKVKYEKLRVTPCRTPCYSVVRKKLTTKSHGVFGKILFNVIY